MVVFLCKQKTAYEVRISDWSSDVCSSDLAHIDAGVEEFGGDPRRAQRDPVETGAQPIEAAIDRRGVGARPIAHRARITLCPRDGFGNAPAGRAPALGGVVYISAFLGDDGVHPSVAAAVRWGGSSSDAPRGWDKG